MSEAEQDRLQILVNDEFLVSTLRKHFELVVNKSLPGYSNPSDANEIIGEQYRAYLTARNIVQTAFFELEGFKKTITNNEKLNRGR